MAQKKKIIDAIPNDLKAAFKGKPQLGKLTFEDIEIVNSQLRQFYMRDPQAYQREAGGSPDMGTGSQKALSTQSLPNSSGSDPIPTVFFPPACGFCWPSSCGFCWP